MSDVREDPSNEPSRAVGKIPRGVWVLGFVSMLMDTSSEMIHALLPVYLASVLGASAAVIGIIEGVAEATASLTKVLSGTFSDRLGKRKFLAAAGYGIAAATKPVFALAPNVGWIAAARFTDRVGKGIRGAPRDALVADLSPQEIRGASFGLRQSLDTVGAFIGPLLAILLMWLTADRYRLVFWFAAVPAVLSFSLIALGVKEPRHTSARQQERPSLTLSGMARLGRRFWMVVVAGGLFSLARFSEAFLILRAQSSGLSVTLVPLALVVMNVAYALSAYPAGVMSDRVGRIGLLATGLVLLSAADLILAGSATIPFVMTGVFIWGLHMGFTQGVFSALVADASPAELRGSAFGIFNLVSGGSLLAASALAGLLWVAYGAPKTFIAGAVLGVLCLVSLVPLKVATTDT